MPVMMAGCDDLVRKPFQEAEGEGEAPGDVLTLETLAELPDDLIAELKQAIIDLDVDLIQAVIERIRRLDPTVADGLAHLVRYFQYDKILAMI